MTLPKSFGREEKENRTLLGFQLGKNATENSLSLCSTLKGVMKIEEATNAQGKGSKILWET